MRVILTAGRWLLVLTGLLAVAGEPMVVLKTAGQETSAPKFVHANGEVSGLCPDILAAISKVDTSLSFSGQQVPWSLPQIERGLESGRFDVFCGLVRLPRREKLFSFVSTPLYTIRHKVAVRYDDNVQVADLDELARLSAASPRNLVIVTAGISFIDGLKARGIDIDAGSSNNNINLRKLIGGRARFMYHNELVLAALIKDQHAEQQVKLLPAVLGEEAQQLAVSKQLDPAVVTRLANAVKTLRQTGELDRIYNRYIQP